MAFPVAQPDLPAPEPILLFAYATEDDLKRCRCPAMATHIIETLPRNPERTVALRKLLESKDAAVRARCTDGPAADAA
jgi:hypothetical protein